MISRGFFREIHPQRCKYILPHPDQALFHGMEPDQKNYAVDSGYRVQVRLQLFMRASYNELPFHLLKIYSNCLV
jgi:hypothetical protein